MIRDKNDPFSDAIDRPLREGQFGVGRLDQRSRFVASSPSLCAFLGFSAEEFLHMTLNDIVHPVDHGQLQERLDKLHSGSSQGFSAELQVLPKEGAPIWSACQVLPFFDPSVPHYALVLSALPGYSQTVSALRASERRYKTLLSNLAGVAYRSVPDGKGGYMLEYVSEGTRDLFNVAPEDMMSGAITPADVVHPDDFQMMRMGTSEALEKHVMARNVFRVRQPDGGFRWVLETCRGVYDADGKVEALEGFITDIHEQKLISERLSESEHALMQSERQHKALLSNLVGVAFRMGATETDVWLEYVSDGVRDLFGVEPEALTSNQVTLDQVIDRDDRRAMRDSILAALNTRTSTRNVVRGLQPDGSFRWMVVTMRAVTNDDGATYVIEGLITDIHEQKEIEERLFRKEKELREAHELVGLGRWEHDHATGELTWSEEIFHIFGRDPETFRPHIDDFLDAVHPDDRAQESALHFAALKSREPYSSVHRIVRPDGEVRHIAERGETTFDADGQPIRTIGTTLDVTGLKRAEQALLEEQAFKNALLESSDFAVIACDADGKLKMFNRAAREWHGMDAMDIPPEEWPKHYALFTADGKRPLKPTSIPLYRALNGDTVRDAEMSVVLPGKPPRYITCNGGPLHDASGRKLGAMVIMRDVTRQRLTEANLRQRDAILSAVAFAAERLLTTWDWEQEIGTILSTLGQAMHAGRAYVLRAKPDQNNRVFASVLHEWCAPGITPTAIWDQPKGFDIFAAGLGHWAERMQLGGVMQTRSRDFLPAEQTMMEPQGIKAIIALPIFVHGNWWGILGFDDCETDRHWSLAEQEALRAAANTIASAIERRRQQEDRLARVVAEEASQAKSAFLATMSHEIRTPMNAIIGLSEVLNQSDLNDEQSDLLSAMHDAGRHLLHLIDDILDISKIEAGQVKMLPSAINLGETVDAVVGSLISTAAEKGVVVHAFVSPELPDTIMIDGLRLRQVIYNLLGNAIKFSAEMPDRTGRVELRVDSDEDAATGLRVTVRDNGIGMSEELMARVFEPFAQGDSQLTRRYGGTGLGLAITRRIVSMMGGQVSVFSTPGEGSTFTLDLPLTAVESTAPVEAEKPLSGLTCRVMESCGYIAQDIVAYLRHAGACAQIAKPDGADQSRKSPQDEVSLLISDSHQDRYWSEASEVPRLVIEPDCGRLSRPRALSGQVTVVNGTGLSFNRLVEAVLLATGRLPRGHAESLGGDDVERGYADYPGLLPILVAEDDAMNQKVIRRQLELLSLRAEFTSNGREALVQARAGEHALLLTDLHMPDMDGYALARHIRDEGIMAGETTEGAEPRRLPILALTADARQEVVDAVREAGMDGLLIKPVTLKALDAALRPWLSKGIAPATLDPPAVAPAPSRLPESAPLPPPPELAESEGPILDLSELAARIGDDEDIQREFLNVFREQMSPLAAQINEAAGSRDLNRIGALAHRLKSSSRAVGAMDLGAVCARIEEACRKEDTNELGPLLTRFGLSAEAVGSAIARAVGGADHVRH